MDTLQRRKAEKWRLPIRPAADLMAGSFSPAHFFHSLAAFQPPDAIPGERDNRTLARLLATDAIRGPSCGTLKADAFNRCHLGLIDKIRAALQLFCGRGWKGLRLLL